MKQRTQARNSQEKCIKLEEKLSLLGRLVKCVPEVALPFSLWFPYNGRVVATIVWLDTRFQDFGHFAAARGVKGRRIRLV